jgi:hypothetical protein
MAVPSSGPISLTDIQAEFGGPGSPISLGSYYKNGLYVTSTSDAPNVPTSGPIALSDFYGARKLSLYTFTYTGNSTFVLPSSFAGSLIVNAMLGGGGGGGGSDAGQLGYSGYPGGFLTGGTISANPGDTVQIYTGGGGGAGTSNAGGASGGAGGPSASVNWSTLNMLGTPGNFRYTNDRYCGFLNTYGIWNYSQEYPSFDQTAVINFPFGAVYTFIASCDNYGTIYVDGGPVLDIGGYETTYSTTVYIAAGNHAIRLLGINQGGPGAIGLTIVGGGFSGGNGGTAGPSGASGGGGGGGGGTVILINNSIQAVAPGGGGGGGAGYNSGGRPNQNTPGNNGTYYGGTGESNSGDGGGGGGGAGGFNGGAGGAVYGGDDGAYSGENGAPLTPSGGAASTGSNGGGPTAPGGSGYVTVSYYA